MALPTYPADDVAFLEALNSGTFDEDTNPEGMADGGHIGLWPEAMAALSNVAEYHAALGTVLQAMAIQVAADAASAAAGSGTEASAAQIRAGINAFFISIRRVYEANVPVLLTDAPTVAWDMSAGINFDLTLAAAGRSLANPSNKIVGKSGVLRVYQDATGGRSIGSYGGDYVWIDGEPSWPTTAGAWIVVVYTCLANGKVELTFGGASA